MKIVVTGADGFLGWHVRCFLLMQPDVTVTSLTREDFADESRRVAAVTGADAVIHLAGMNRGDEQEVYDTNRRLMQELLDSCDASGARPYIVFSSSTHVTRDTGYGRSKREAGEQLLAWARTHEDAAGVFIFPNIFGEEARPHYNSAVATFCHDLATGSASEVNAAAPVTLVHAQEAARVLFDACQARVSGEQSVAGVETTIGVVYKKLSDMHALYARDVIPACDTAFDLALFNSLRSALYEHDFYPRALVARSDARGSLFEAIKQQGGGQTFFSLTHPGQKRGDHYHARKIERFCVVSGEADITVRKLFSDETRHFQVRGDEPAFIDMPTFFAHTITNTGLADVLTLFWCNEIFDAADPDTFAHIV